MMVHKKKIELEITAGQWLDYAVNKTGITVIALTPQIAIESCNLPGDFHKDPADRIIVASARAYNMTLVTKDKRIDSYPYVRCLW